MLIAFYMVNSEIEDGSKLSEVAIALTNVPAVAEKGVVYAKLGKLPSNE
jgi:hypothetical protein